MYVFFIGKNMRKYLILFVTLVLAACGATPNSVVTSLKTQITNAGSPPAGVSATVDDVFNWAEKTYPQYFSSHQNSANAAGYVYRFYPNSGVWLLFENGKIVVWDSAIADGYAEIASLSDFTCVVNPTLCKPEAEQIKISTNITQNVYPSAYTTTQLLPTVDDTCALGGDTVQYPASYMGNLALPKFSGASLNTVPLAMSLKDNWNDAPINNPNLNIGCTTTNRSGFLQTLVRIKKLNASKIYIPQYVCIQDVNNPDLDFASTGFVSIPDADLVWMGQQAAAIGIKSQLLMQICTHDSRGYLLSNFVSPNWILRFFTGYSKFMLSQAKLIQSAGFDAISLDWTDWQPSAWDNFQQIRETNLLALSSNIRSVFNGKQYLIQTNNTITATPKLLDAVDFIQLQLIAGPIPTAAEELTMSVDMLKPRYSGFIPYILKIINSTKPVSWLIMIESVNNPYSNHHTASDAGCPGGNAPCANSNYTADFGRQAIGIEAALEAINEQTSVKTDSVAIPYWLADNITQHDSYPNFSPSIRNKPAESIVYQWFRP